MEGRFPKAVFWRRYSQIFSQEDEDFPNLAETVILKDTWGVISRQVSTLIWFFMRKQNQCKRTRTLNIIFEIFPTFLNKTEIFRWNQLAWRRSRKCGASTLTWASIFDPTVSSSPAMLKGGTSKHGFWKMHLLCWRKVFWNLVFLEIAFFAWLDLLDWLIYNASGTHSNGTSWVNRVHWKSFAP